MSIGNFSRNTFDQLKHYVGVRLQQGVPIVDADWNELEDIRKHELETFLKWFVGNGIPLGNDGFKIELAHQSGNLRLAVNGEFDLRTTLSIDCAKSTAADTLGFGADNCSALSTGLAARLAGSKKEPFALTEGMTLVINAKRTPLTSGSQKKAWSRTWKITFQSKAFKEMSKATGQEVAAELARVASDLHVSMGLVHDFIIKGGDGTPEGAGRCLVEGWEVVNEGDVHYADQPLYENGTLAAAWGVDVLPPLTGQKPDQDHSTLYYLDVWERLVNEHEDQDLVNVLIGVPTCVRLKREWAVRVLEGCEKTAVAVPESLRQPGHVYYPLARLEYYQCSGLVSPATTRLVNLRRTGVSIVSQYDFEQTKYEVKTIAAGTFGMDYKVNAYLNTNLREAVNALLRGNLPGEPAASLAKTPYQKTHPMVLDHEGLVHVCWQENHGSATTDAWCLSFMVFNGNTWNAPATFNSSEPYPCNPILLLDADDREMALWISDYDHRKRCIKYTRYVDAWKGDGIMVPNSQIINSDCALAALIHQSYLWLLWMDQDPATGKNVLWYNRRKPDTTGIDAADWDGKKLLPCQTAGHPAAMVDGQGNIRVFWLNPDGKTIQSATCDLKDPAKPVWRAEVAYATNKKICSALSVVKDLTGNVWVFFAAENDNFNRGLWYLKIQPDNLIWALVQLTSGLNSQESSVRAVCNREGEILLTWHRLVNGKIVELWCKRHSSDSGWGQEMQIVPGIFGSVGALNVTADAWHNVWIVYIHNLIENGTPLWEVGCRKLLTYI